MVSIVTIPHPALRKVSKPLSLVELKGKEFKTLLLNLSAALATRDDGVGLSAPQIAINKRIFVVSGKVFDKNWQNNKTPSPTLPPDEYFINPIITKISKKLSILEEGCLSIPELYGMVKRPTSVSIQYLNQDAEKVERRATGILARIFQHEIDHLDGILFTDKATDIKRMKDTHDNSEL